MTEANLLRVYEARNDYTRAEPLLQRMVETERQMRGSNSAEVAAGLAALGVNRLRQQKFAEAEAPLRESLHLYQSHQPDGWQHFQAQSLLGDCLLGQKKSSDAEPLLVKGYEGLKQREAQVPKEPYAPLVEAAERLVRLYQALGRNDEVDRWRKVLLELKGSANKS
jgi:hypothetical protein